jgi:hypothetical protein
MLSESKKKPNVRYGKRTEVLETGNIPKLWGFRSVTLPMAGHVAEFPSMSCHNDADSGFSLNSITLSETMGCENFLEAVKIN